MIELFQFEALGCTQAGAAQTYRVEAANTIITAGDRIGRKVFTNGRAALHQRERADTHKLMNETIAGNESAVRHADVAAQQATVGNDNGISDPAVVCDVA